MQTMETKFPVTAVCFGADAHTVLSGGIDNVVRVWDLRKLEVLHGLQGHTGDSLKEQKSYELFLSLSSLLSRFRHGHGPVAEPGWQPRAVHRHGQHGAHVGSAAVRAEPPGEDLPRCAAQL